MRTTKLLAVLSLIMLPFAIGLSQETDKKPPQEAEFRDREPTILKAIEWLEQHPFTEDTSKRKDVAGIVLKWLIDCPYVGVNVDTKYIREVVRDTSYEHGGLLVSAFLFGKAHYIILHQSDPNERLANTAGLEAIIRTYRSIKRDRPSDPICKGAESLDQMMEDDELSTFVLKREEEK